MNGNHKLDYHHFCNSNNKCNNPYTSVKRNDRTPGSLESTADSYCSVAVFGASQHHHLSAVKDKVLGDPPLQQQKPALQQQPAVTARLAGYASGDLWGRTTLKTQQGKTVCEMRRLFKRTPCVKDFETLAVESLILQEVTVLYEANSPWVPKLYYAWQDPHFIYLLMEFVSGGDLMKHLSNAKRFNESTCRFLIAELVLALSYIHGDLECAHRDIKPENILFDSKGHVKVADFGLSKFVGKCLNRGALPTRPVGSTVPSTVPKQDVPCVPSSASKIRDSRNVRYYERLMTGAGTTDYMAPEIHRQCGSRRKKMRNQLGYTRTADWWSVGVVMFDMLYGTLPFSDRQRLGHVTTDRIINWKRHLKFLPNFPISASCEDFLRHLLAEPQDRFRNASEAREHPWLRAINWDHIREQSAPLSIDRSPLGLRNFDLVEIAKFTRWEHLKKSEANSVGEKLISITIPTPPPEKHIVRTEPDSRVSAKPVIPTIDIKRVNNLKGEAVQKPTERICPSKELPTPQTARLLPTSSRQLVKPSCQVPPPRVPLKTARPSTDISRHLVPSGPGPRAYESRFRYSVGPKSLGLRTSRDVTTTGAITDRGEGRKKQTTPAPPTTSLEEWFRERSRRFQESISPRLSIPRETLLSYRRELKDQQNCVSNQQPSASSVAGRQTARDCVINIATPRLVPQRASPVVPRQALPVVPRQALPVVPRQASPVVPQGVCLTKDTTRVPQRASAKQKQQWPLVPLPTRFRELSRIARPRASVQTAREIPLEHPQSRVSDRETFWSSRSFLSSNGKSTPDPADNIDIRPPIQVAKSRVPELSRFGTAKHVIGTTLIYKETGSTHHQQNWRRRRHGDDEEKGSFTVITTRGGSNFVVEESKQLRDGSCNKRGGGCDELHPSPHYTAMMLSQPLEELTGNNSVDLPGKGISLYKGVSKVIGMLHPNSIFKMSATVSSLCV